VHPDASTQRSTNAVRVVTAALCAVLVVLAGVAIWGGISAERSGARLARSGDLIGAYLDLTRAVALQDAAEEGFAERTRQSSRRQFEAAGVSIAVSVQALERLGDPADRALGARIERYEQAYAADFRRYFGALDAGDVARAEAAEEAADPSSQALQFLVSEGGPRQARRSLREVDALRSFQGRILRITLLSVLLGTCVAVVLWSVLYSLRRRMHEATQEQIARLGRAALTDSLTGIRNHRAFEEDIVRTLADQRRHGRNLSLVMLDLDGLKAINDVQGHQAGDRAIKAVGNALSATVRASDSIYRIGGDEFAALLPDAAAWEAFNFAQRLHGALGSTASITVSAGVAEASVRSSRKGLIEQADIALLEAKSAGRATIVFTPGMAHSDVSDDPEDRHHRGTLASALARAVDAKDSYTRSHSETVAELCAIIATQLGLEPERVAAARLAGLVHDVGKIGVPDAILQKPAALDPHEYAIIKTHSTLGHKILHGTDLTREAPWVLHHHERMDGAGYPSGLSGSDIPLEARIIHVADAFEAMTSDRPYRRGMPEQAALDELQRHTGTQFDPECVSALLRALGITSGPADEGHRCEPSQDDASPAKMSVLSEPR
jgi:diguanylate cyclase (GGDEF)-like protein